MKRQEFYISALLRQAGYVIVVCSALLTFNGCSKDAAPGDPGSGNNTDNTKAHLLVNLTDAPGDYSAVFIDVQGVEVTGSANGNVLLNVNSGIYNLLDFANGVDTLIASGLLEPGYVSQLRLILGANNSIVVDNVTYPLFVPSGMESGLKILVNRFLDAGQEYVVKLDFDADQSILSTGDGRFLLKPVLRSIHDPVFGSISGEVSPEGTRAVIVARQGKDTYTTRTDGAGRFLLDGLPEGVYTVDVVPKPPFLPVVIQDVNVSTGAKTDLGTITLDSRERPSLPGWLEPAHP